MKSPRSSVLVLVLALHLEVHGEPEPEAAPRGRSGLSSLGRAPGTHQEALTKYLLSRLLGNSEEASPYSQRRDSDSSYKFPLRHKDPLQKLLDHAKANIDVIDFRNPDRKVGGQDN